MKESMYKNYEELPLMLNAKHIGELFGISLSSAYELMREEGFPCIRIGSRQVVPKDKLIAWIDRRAME